MPVLLMFLLWPLAEIATFAVVGDWIGAFDTVLLVIVSGLAGLAILRRQGLSALRAARGDGAPPVGKMLDGLATAFAGVLLIVPGFLTDILAVALLIPGVRQGLGALMLRQLVKNGGSMRFEMKNSPENAKSGFSSANGEIIDVEFTEVAPKTAPPSRQVEDQR